MKIKEIDGYEGYLVNEAGEIFNKKTGRNIKTRKLTNTGYEDVEIRSNKCRKKFLVHRLVALAFIPNELNKPYVNHIDGNRLNNTVSNLEWVTGNENSMHRIFRNREITKKDILEIFKSKKWNSVDEFVNILLSI